MIEMNRSDAFVGGAWVPLARTVPVHDPATGAQIGTAGSAQGDDADAAVAAATRARDSWELTTGAQRADLIDALVAQLRRRRDELVAVTVAEVGAPVRVAEESHIDLGIEVLAAFADGARSLDEPRIIDNSRVLRRPAGVVAAITPWNYPFYQLVAKLGAILAAGCTVIIKPAELTPLSAYLVAEAADAAGIPAGVVNLVPGSGRVVGTALTEHPDVDVVSFTGSTGIGRTVALAAAERIARACLELGGKSASIVLDDADLSAAVRASVDAAMLNTGQTCSAWTRLVVPRARLADAEEIAAARASELVVGDPSSRETEIGPLISAAHRSEVAAVIDGAAARGGRVLTGGTGPVPGLTGGHFLAPTVISGLAEDDPAVREEIFGPVLVMLPHDGDEDALRIANDSAYGLHGAVWSSDRDRAVALAARMRTGQVDVNGAAFNPRAPFGGWKASGLGRELGATGVDEFSELVSIQL